MDKLVEQGKQELAKAELQHVLERHFRPVTGTGLPAKNPPLALGVAEEESIKPARWIIAEPKTNVQPSNEESLLPATQFSTTSIKAMDNSSLQPQPLTQWIPLYKILKPGASPEAPEMENKNPDSELAPEDSEVSSPEKPEKKPDILSLYIPNDTFVRKGIRKFIKHKNQLDIFELKEQENIPPDSQDQNKEESSFSDFMLLKPWSQPSRYLRAIRAEKSCLAAGCHGPKPNLSAEAEGPPTFDEGQLVGVISVLLPAGQTSITLLFNRIFIILAGLLSCVCAVVTFYMITQRFILQPLRALRDAAEQVTVPSDEAADTDKETKESWQEAMAITENIRTGDEFQRLAQAFHHMLERLKLAQDRLRESNRALDMRLGELEAKNLALFESNKLKSEFLANVSHELRTPLNAILGFAEIMKEQAQQREDAKTTRYASNVLESGNMLLGIINDLLDLAKIEAGKMEVRWDMCSIHDILEVLLNFTRPMIDQKQLRVTSKVESDIGLVETDPSKLQQVLFNLLSNAIKFTPEGGCIDIEAKVVTASAWMRSYPSSEMGSGSAGTELMVDEMKLVQIAIADTGPGIPEAEQENIFEKFRQLDASVTREHNGAGLGLAIVKDLMEILGGRITVQNRQAGGSVFTIQIPFKNRHH
jgi:signal transduction histidine kinase